MYIQGLTIKAINVAWRDFSGYVEGNRKELPEYVVRNVLESFQIDVKDEATQWRIAFAPTQQVDQEFHRAFQRKHPGYTTLALSYLCLEYVIRKKDLKILKRLVSR